MQMISTKQLRQDFEGVRNLLAEGQSVLLIHRSQPIARIEPVEKKPSKKKMLIQVKKITGGLRLGKNLTPEKINKILDGRYENLLSGC